MLIVLTHLVCIGKRKHYIRVDSGAETCVIQLMDDKSSHTFDFGPSEPQEDEADILLGQNLQDFDAAVAATDWTAETIISQLTKGNIDLDPHFQRREAWRIPRKSKFIESLILNIPVPQIILAERKGKKGSYIVIDGKQRLLALRQFTASSEDSAFEKFKLRDLKVLKDLNGCDYADLASKDDNPLAAFDNASIRTVLIKNWSSEAFLYEVFLRINSGSVQLSPQELRQALHPGAFTNYLNEFVTKSKVIHKLLGLEHPDFRMRDNELVLRFLAFYADRENYTGNLKQFLDDITIRFNQHWTQHKDFVGRALSTLEHSIETTRKIFGDGAFKKWNGESFESRINRAVFDVVAIGFATDQVSKAALLGQDKVVNAFKSLCENDRSFMEAITSTTKSKGAVEARFSRWLKALDQAVGT